VTIKMFTVFLVDDEAAVVKAMSRLLRTRGYSVCAYTSSRDFLAQHDPAIPGCALLDVSMPDLDGLELQQAMTGEGIARPVIFMTGKGDVPTSVRAMKAGAVDFLTKPVNDLEIFAALARAEQQDAHARRAHSERASIEEKLATLTPREREVLSHVVVGRLNKQIAGDLGTVEKTIKVHRSRVMAKLGVRTVADLVRLVGKVGLAG
jgi:FixJ family two-component response regulator